MRSVRHGRELSSQASSGPPSALELVLGAAIALLMLDRDRSRPAPVAGGERPDDIGRSSNNEASGRDADSPAVIPPRGWLEVLRRVWDEIGKSDGSAYLNRLRGEIGGASAGFRPPRCAAA